MSEFLILIIIELNNRKVHWAKQVPPTTFNTSKKDPKPKFIGLKPM